MAKPTSRDRIILAALHVAAKKPWHEVTLDQVAKAGKVSLAATREAFPNMAAIPPAVVAYIDVQTAANASGVDDESTPRDHLFEILMARFDIMQSHRHGLLAIAEACRQSPSLGLTVLRQQWTAMQTMLRIAGLEPDAAQTTGLLAIYHHVLRCWMRDSSADMAKTMATLDRSLTRAETIIVALRKR